MDRRSKGMNPGIVSLLLAAFLAGALPAGVGAEGAQPAPRRVSFADVTAAAVENNLQLRAAAFDVAIAQAQLIQARGGKLPQAALSSSYARTQELPLLYPNVYATGLAIAYPLSTGGNLEAQIGLAEANLRGAQATYQRTRQQVLYSAELAYLQGLLAAENAAAARRAMASAIESLRVARARFSAGAAARLDVLQAEVAAANAEQALIQAQAGMASAETGMSAVLNLPLETSLEFTDALALRRVDGTLADAIVRALRERPDMAAFQSQIEVAQASLEVARTGGRPTVSLGVGYGLDNANGLSTDILGSWSVSLRATLPVFDGGVTQAKIREAQLRLQQVRAREAQVRQQVELDVRQAWLGLQQGAGRLTAATKAVEQGRESVRLAAARYQSGVGTSLELLTAQSNLAASEQTLASARYDQNVAQAQLLLATGSL
jgi:outer membrane protein